MIVPMKKVSLIIMGDKKTETLKKLRKLGMIHIEITEGSSERLNELKEQITLLENAVFVAGNKKCTQESNLSLSDALSIAKDIATLSEQKKDYQAEQISLNAELERLKSWGDIDPDSLSDLIEKGINISIYEIPTNEYEALGENVRTVRLGVTKSSVKCLLIKTGATGEDQIINALNT